MRYAQARAVAAAMRSGPRPGARRHRSCCSATWPRRPTWTGPRATAAQHCGVGPLAWPVTTALSAAGLRDSFRVAHPSPLTGRRATPGRRCWPCTPAARAPEPQDRIDYVDFAGRLGVTESHALVTGFPSAEPDVSGEQLDVGPCGRRHDLLIPLNRARRSLKRLRGTTDMPDRPGASSSAGSAAAIGTIAAGARAAGRGRCGGAVGGRRAARSHAAAYRHDQGRQARRGPDAGEPLVRPLLRLAAAACGASPTSSSCGYPDGSSIFQQPDHTRPAAATPAAVAHGHDASSTRRRPTTSTTAGTAPTRAWNAGAWNRWVAAKGEETMGYFTRNDIPWQYALADAFTVCDSYFCSIQGPTTPNRLFHWTGTIDPAGGAGGPAIDNPADYKPVYSWTTYPERLQAAGMSWQVYANDEVGRRRRRLRRRLRRQPAVAVPGLPRRAGLDRPGEAAAGPAGQPAQAVEAGLRPGPGRRPRARRSSSRTARPGRCRPSPGSSRRTATASTRRPGRSTAPHYIARAC